MVDVRHAGWCSCVFAVQEPNATAPRLVPYGSAPLMHTQQNGPISSIVPESHRFRLTASSLQCIDCGLAGDNSASSNLFHATMHAAIDQSHLTAGVDQVFHLACTAGNRVAILTQRLPSSWTLLEYEVQVPVANGHSSTFTRKLSRQIQGQEARLYAGNTFFLLRVNGSRVYSWGDARFRKCLGRDVSHIAADDVGPVSLPFPLVKLAVGGFFTAALSSDGKLVVWGQSRPGHSDGGLPGTDEGMDFSTVAVPGHIAVVDFDVGNGHLIVLTRDRRVFTAGAGECGQLGIGEAIEWRQHLTEVLNISNKRVRKVRCGYASTFALLE